MRILFINKASLNHEGGAEMRSRAVGRQLVASGHDVVVLSAKTRIHDAPVEIVDGMTVYHKKVLPDWLLRRFPAPHYLPLAAASALLMVYLYALLKRERFDCIREDLSPFPPSFLLAFVRLSVPDRVAVVHNPPATFKGWVRSYGVLYGTVGFTLDRCLKSGRLKFTRIVCVAKWLADDLKHFPKIASKVCYVPNGVDVELFTMAKTARSEAGAFRLLAVGRLVKMKGFEYLIESLPRLIRTYPKLQLTILGNGPLSSSLLHLATRLGVAGQVEMRPPVPQDEMPRVLANSDFLVVPSLSEGLPLILLEAMAAQVPIVATAIPGTLAVLDEQGATLCHPSDALDLAEKLKWAFDHPDEVAQKLDAAYHRALHYRWARVADQEITGCISE